MEFKAIIEALLFSAGQPVSVKELVDLFHEVEPEVTLGKADIEQILQRLKTEWQASGRGFTLEEVGGGFEFRTRPEYASWVSTLRQTRPQRLSLPALESLAIIAYRQPITRADLESLRGVDCGGVLKSLGDRHLIRVIGRKEDPGRPLLYGTTREFLEFFGLNNLNDLPPLKEFEEKVKSMQAKEVPESLSVADLTTSPEELISLEVEDRTALEALETSLADLKEVEKNYLFKIPND